MLAAVPMFPEAGFELARQLRAGGRCTGVPDPDGLLGALCEHGGGGRALRPGAAWAAVGGDEDFEFFAQRGDEDEAGVWYLVAVFPPRVRQALPAGTSHLGQSLRYTAFAA